MPDERCEFALLLDRVKGGDDLALAQLMKKYGGAFRQTARELLGKRLQRYLDSEDLVQGLQIILWRGLRSSKFCLRTPAQLLALARTILLREVAHHARKLQLTMAGTVEIQQEATLADQPLSDGQPQADPDHVFDSHDTVDRFLSVLDEVDRELVQLRMLGCSTAEAARRLNLAPAYLRVRLSRLRKRFRHFRDRPEEVGSVRNHAHRCVH